MATASDQRSVFTEHAWIRGLKTKRHEFLSALNAAMPWDKVYAKLEPWFPRHDRGRPRIPFHSMLRLHVYQLATGLNDRRAIEDMLENRLVEAFCDWDITSRDCLGRTTLNRFRHRIREAGQEDWLVEVVAKATATARHAKP